MNAFYRYDYKSAIRIFREKSKEENKDYVLNNLALLSSAITAGDYWDAEEGARNAMRFMWSDAGKGQGVASLVSAESIKVFKGEPFEKSMTAIYAGIIFYNRGDYDNARAAFGKAVLAVKQKEENRDNFALPYLLQSKVMLKLGDQENARNSFERAQKAEHANLSGLTFEALKSSNALFLVELGRAPMKTRTGPGKSLVEWRRQNYLEREARISVDGRENGKGAQAGDLTYQAQTKGWTGKDTVQIVKGSAREAAAITTAIAANKAAKGDETAGWVALGAGLFTLADQSQADVRQWEILPDLIQVIPGRIPEGMHTIRIRFYDQYDKPLNQYEQGWYYVPMIKGEDKIFLFRSGPYKGSSTG